MTEHTPGPWHVIEACYEAYRGSHSIGSVDVRVAKVARNGVIAAVLRDDVEGEANARLIAAAPDLLEALYLLVVDVRVAEVDKDGGMRFSERIRHAEAAIAKATGGP